MSLWDFARSAGSDSQIEADHAWQLAEALLEAGLPDGLALTPGVGLIWHQRWLAVSILADVDRLAPNATIRPLLEGQIVPLQDIAILRDRVAEALPGRADWMWKVMVMGVKEPSFHIAPGNSITGPDTGTVGATVKWATGSGFLTAGHVAPAVGAHVYEHGIHIGSVVWANDPASHGLAIEPDVAVVELVSGVGMTSTLTGPVQAGPNAAVTVLSTGNAGNVMGLNAFLYMPAQNATCGDTYMTTSSITSPGDSGGPVTLANSNDVIGHVIGGSSNITSYIQDIQYQVREASNPARHGLPGLRM